MVFSVSFPTNIRKPFIVVTEVEKLRKILV